MHKNVKNYLTQKSGGHFYQHFYGKNITFNFCFNVLKTKKKKNPQKQQLGCQAHPVNVEATLWLHTRWLVVPLLRTSQHPQKSHRKDELLHSKGKAEVILQCADELAHMSGLWGKTPPQGSLTSYYRDQFIDNHFTSVLTFLPIPRKTLQSRMLFKSTVP